MCGAFPSTPRSCSCKAIRPAPIVLYAMTFDQAGISLMLLQQRTHTVRVAYSVDPATSTTCVVSLSTFYAMLRHVYSWRIADDYVSYYTVRMSCSARFFARHHEHLQESFNSYQSILHLDSTCYSIYEG